MRTIYKMVLDCGRQGVVSGIFAADSDDFRVILGKKFYMDDVLGKHSEICGVFDEGDFQVVTDDKGAVDIFDTYQLACGYNPFDFVD